MATDTRLNDMQRQYRNLARDFAMSEIAPRAAGFDSTGDFPASIVEQAWELRLTTTQIPEPYGGLGLGVADSATMIEELAAGCCGVAHVIVCNIAAQLPLILCGSEAQKREMLGALAEKPLVSGYACGSLSAGSSAGYGHLRARKTANGYALDGVIPHMMQAARAQWYNVVAQVGGENGASPEGGMPSAFVIRRQTGGVSVGPKLASLGLKALHIHPVEMKDVHVDDDSLVGEPGQAMAIAALASGRLYPLFAAASVGMARSALEHAVAYSKERKTFNLPIAQHQAVAFMLADMAKDIEAARLLMWNACLAADDGSLGCEAAFVAKAFCQSMAMRVATDAVQIFGGYGYSREYPVEKAMRDAKVSQVLEDTSLDICRQLAAGLVGAGGPGTSAPVRQ